MKKIFKIVLSLTMALVLTVFASGCDGCNGNTALTFNQNFYGKGEPIVGYKETLTYSVKFDDNYNSTLAKDPSLSDKVAKYTYLGEYKTVFEVKSNLPDNIDTNVSTEGMVIYHLTNALNLKSTYKVNGNYVEGGVDNGDGTISYDEYITSEIYFLKAGHSFAPIYSKSAQKYTYITLGSNSASVNLYQSEFTTNYNKDSYKITTTADGTTTTKSHEYSFKSLIDNAQLLFAIRCLDIAVDGSESIPVVSPSYSSAQTLLIRNTVENTKKININGQDADIPVKNYKFNVNNKFNTGTPHFALIQKSSPSNAIPNKALVIEYSAPLVTYGNFVNMGALLYTLTTAEIQA